MAAWESGSLQSSSLDLDPCLVCNLPIHLNVLSSHKDRRITSHCSCTHQADACAAGCILHHQIFWLRCDYRNGFRSCEFFLTRGQQQNTDSEKLLAPANDALLSPCLTGVITEYPWVEGIALMTIFTMFFIELMASRFQIFGDHSHDIEASDPTKDMLRYSDNKTQDSGMYKPPRTQFTSP